VSFVFFVVVFVCRFGTAWSGTTKFTKTTKSMLDRQSFGLAPSGVLFVSFVFFVVVFVCRFGMACSGTTKFTKATKSMLAARVLDWPRQEFSSRASCSWWWFLLEQG
jgi:hypothetical protein